jgi:hypothetical protein
MLVLQTIPIVSSIRLEEELAQVHQRLDRLFAVQAYDSLSQDLRDELEILTMSNALAGQANLPIIIIE